MSKPATPALAEDAEALRLAELRTLKILDTAADERFDIITRLAAQMFDTPMSLVSLVDRDRQWFKSAVGVDLPQMPRDVAFCEHAIREGDLLVVPDAALDPRFVANPLVTGAMQVRFYAGVVLRGPSGQPVGTLCVLDHRPRAPTPQELSRLQHLARLVEWEMRQDVLIERLLRESEHNALYHPATGVPNRQHIFERLEQVIAGGDCGSVLVILGSIDNLETLPDGSGTSDRLLRALIQRLQHIDDGIELGFWRQNQFLLFQAHVGLDAAPRLLDRLRNAFKHALRVDGCDYQLTATVGVSQYPDDAVAARPLLQWARLAMPTGEPGMEPLRVGNYSRDLAARRERHRAIAQRLTRALAEGALSLVYQPVFEIGSGELSSCEALLRWNDATLGSVSPAEFIPIAEEAELIGGIGAFVLGQVTRQLHDWRARRLQAVPVSVNVSSQQLRDPDFSRTVQHALEDDAIPGRLLQLEVTEHALISDIVAATSTLRRIAALGVACAVDDFGVGYSSFNYLRHLPIATLKVDCEFIAEIDHNLRDQDIVRAIIAMAHSLGLKVIAEGVETIEQLEVLRGLHCDRVQGFLKGHGVPAAAFEKLLEAADAGTAS